MRQSENFPLDPDVAAELQAIDATLAGQLVDPEFAELAELTVMVAAERPQISPDRALEVDRRVLSPGSPSPSRRSRRRWHVPSPWVASLGLAAAAAVALVVWLPHGGGSSGGMSSVSSTSGSASSGAAQAIHPAAKPSARNGSVAPKGSASKGSASGPSMNLAPALKSSSGASTYSAPQGASVAPAPVPTARKTIQSAQLQLSAPGRWVEVVAQEVYNVAGQEKAIVRSSQVTATAGPGGQANFNLSVPSSNLADTVSRLSALQHARVSSRTDGSQDVNGQYLSDQRRLGDARALRTSLLKQLAKATTPAQVSSLQAQIHSAEAQIASDQSTLRHLQYQVSFSQLYVTINGGSGPLPLGSSSRSGGGFTIGRAAHDAVNVLTVAAGVALIVLAALVPIVLVVALLLWARTTMRRRRREHALDTA